MAEPGDYWNEQAATFDEEPDHGLRDPAVRAAWESLLLPLLPPPPAQIADLGCGTGTLGVLLAQAGYRVCGVDSAARMVEAARAKAAAANVVVDFQHGDAMAPPWPPLSFDAVLSRHVLWALADPGLALERWSGILTPGGRLVLIEGRWWTGGGITAAEALALVRSCGREAETVALADPALWGGPVPDERYLLVSPPRE